MAASPILESHGSSAEAICLLLHPFAEVVLHDLSTKKIVGLWNGFSGRRVGDASLLEAGQDRDRTDGAPTWGPYEKTGPRGERLKSVTAVLRGPFGAGPAGLLCINLDISRLNDAQRLLAAFVSLRQEQPAALFGGDWREHMQTALHSWLRNNGLSISSLKRDERIKLVGDLDAQHLFATRNGAEHAAQMLGTSRTSIYNYLRAARVRAKQNMRIG